MSGSYGEREETARGPDGKVSCNQGSKFDTEHWYHTLMDRRTRQIIQERANAFETENENAPDELLLAAVRRRAQELGYAPFPVEVIGAALICQRFGSWHRALYAAGLPAPRGASRLADSKLYKAEYEHQQKLYRVEKQEKKEIRRQRSRERALRDEKRRQQRLPK